MPAINKSGTVAGPRDKAINRTDQNLNLYEFYMLLEKR